MRFRGTLLLIVFLAVLCGVYWGLEYRRAHQRVTVEASKELYTFKPEAVTRLSIQQIGESATVAERMQDGGWRIVAPHEGIRAFPPLWDRVAANLAALKNQRTIQAGATDLKPFGLSEPALVVEAQVAGTEGVSVQFGSLDPTDRFRYARASDGTVFLVDKNSYFELDRKLEDLRHRFLVNDRESPLKYIEFVRIWTGREKTTRENPPAVGEESVRVVLQRESPEAPWQMKEPVDAAASQEDVNKLAAELQFGVGHDFVDAPEKLADYGFEPPGARITVEDFKGTGTQTFEMGAPSTQGEKGGVYARRLGEDAVFAMDANLLVELPREPYAFRERRLFTGSAKEIKRIEFTGQGGGYVLTRNAEGVWMMEAPEAGETDPLFVSNFIASLTVASGIGFLDGTLADHGLDQPDAAFKLTMEGKTEPLTIGLRKELPKPGFYVVTQDTGAMMRMPQAIAQQLIQPAGRFRTRQLLRFDKEQAAALDLSLEGRRFQLEKVHGKWLVRAPASGALENQSDVEALLSAMTPLISLGSALGVDAGDPKLGLGTPVAALTVSLAGETPESGLKPLETLTIGNPTEDDAQQRYATISGREGVFLIKQDVLEAVRRGVASLGAEPGPEGALPGNGHER